MLDDGSYFFRDRCDMLSNGIAVRITTLSMVTVGGER